jgi:hypothetical protein
MMLKIPNLPLVYNFQCENCFFISFFTNSLHVWLDMGKLNSHILRGIGILLLFFDVLTEISCGTPIFTLQNPELPQNAIWETPV